MLARIVVTLVVVLGAQSRMCSAGRPRGALYIADGTADVALVATVTDARTHQPVSGAVVTAIRAGTGTVLVPGDSPAMPPPVNTDFRGHAILHANFRYAADPMGSCLFVARSFLRVKAPGFRSKDVRISSIGRLDFAPEPKHYHVTIPIALMHE